MIPTLKLLVRKMQRTKFDKLTQTQRRQVLSLYRELSEPMDELWRAMMRHIEANPPKPLVVNKKQLEKKLVKRRRR